MDKPDMVMVPREPTEAMIAAAERLYDFPLGSSTAINSPAPDAIWSAMLSAAPPPSVGEGVRERVAAIRDEAARGLKHRPGDAYLVLIQDRADAILAALTGSETNAR